MSASVPAKRPRLDRELVEARDSEIARRYLAGEALSDIGRTFGLTGERCRQILVARGVPRRGPTPRKDDV